MIKWDSGWKCDSEYVHTTTNQPTTTMKTKQYQQGWTAYFEGDHYDNPYTKPKWVLEWDLGYFEAKEFNQGR